MHEMSLIHNLLTKIQKVALAHNAERVVGVYVEIGALAHISAGHFREHFEAETVGTLAERAQLHIEVKSDIHDPHAQDILLKKVDVAEA